MSTLTSIALSGFLLPRGRAHHPGMPMTLTVPPNKAIHNLVQCTKLRKLYMLIVYLANSNGFTASIVYANTSDRRTPGANTPGTRTRDLARCSECARMASAVHRAPRCSAYASTKNPAQPACLLSKLPA